nr:DNA-protecting protein DprA [Desulfobulbaceae bacterium]
MTTITENTKAILLLCAFLNKDDSVKPLTQTEYTTLTQSLLKEKLTPSSLYDSELLAQIAEDSGLGMERLKGLMDRGMQLGFALEKWGSDGIWVVSRSDAEYPQCIKRHIKHQSPPFLYGVGDRKLLVGGGVAFVGSRNIDTDGFNFTKSIVQACVKQGITVISGAAKGVDETSMDTAISGNGKVIGIVADRLRQKSLKKSYRTAIAKQNLLLLSPYHPEAGFNVGNAMARNKLIYAIADYSIVVSADHNKGGTWAGAKEELRRKPAKPVYVRKCDKPEGNRKLVELGAIEFPEIQADELILKALADAAKSSKPVQEELPSLFDFMGGNNVNSQPKEKALDIPEAKSHPPVVNNTVDKGTGKDETNSTTDDIQISDAVYHAVIPIIINELREPKNAAELAEHLNVNKTQLNDWLGKALSQKLIIKKTKPVRFQKA